MNNFLSIIYCFTLSFVLITFACQAPIEQSSKPNVILIMADDIGFECLSINGSVSYKTPVLDSLATHGINFTKAISQPLCTPSRVKIMTGKFNYKNYDYFTYLNPKEKSFGNLFKENGYKTAIVGKWQLNGIVHKLEGFDDNTRPNHFGFDEYSLWQLTKTKSYGERFANPYIEQNGKILPRDENAYGPDIVSNYAIDFIKRNRDQPFFIYYPMLLVHSPFVPTPDSPEWQSLDTRSKQENRFFIDMVAYMDKIVGKIVNELKNQGTDFYWYVVGDGIQESFLRKEIKRLDMINDFILVFPDLLNLSRYKLIVSILTPLNPFSPKSIIAATHFSL